MQQEVKFFQQNNSKFPKFFSDDDWWLCSKACLFGRHFLLLLNKFNIHNWRTTVKHFYLVKWHILENIIMKNCTTVTYWGLTFISNQCKFEFIHISNPFFLYMTEYAYIKESKIKLNWIILGWKSQTSIHL